MAIDGILTAAGLPGATGVSLNRILWAYRTGRLPEPARLGCHRVHTPEDVERIKRYFQEVDEQRRVVRGRKAAGRPKKAGRRSPHEAADGRPAVGIEPAAPGKEHRA